MLPFSFFDAHCDTLSRCTHLGWDMAESVGHTDLKRGKAFAHYAQVFAIFRDGAKPPAEGMFSEFLHQQSVFEAQMKKHSDAIVQCFTREDLEKARQMRKVAAILSVEGAELLECDPAKLDTAKKLGVKMINLTWNRGNALSGTNVEEPQRGLSEQGRAFVKRAQALDILLDVSHLSDPGFWDLVEMAEKPIVASHSNSRRLCEHTRNLTDDMFRAICESGGFVGINFYLPFVGGDHSVDALMAHIEHFLELGGEKTVGFGGDWDGCDQLPAGIRGVEDLGRVYEKMLQRNYPGAVIEDIFYNNLQRTLFQE